ncbi:hypothetical protein DFH28DRAFT_1125990 [Melampsora americana]|nr:hypothetical protein DFH28DRAFT_1125990 [Melampsora americana]
MQTRADQLQVESLAAAKQSPPTLTSNNLLRQNKPPLPLELQGMNLEEQAEYVTTRFREIYGVEPKTLQVKAAVCLINGDNTFLLAATGYGKTRIAEMYYYLFDELQLPVVLLLNPLNSLGDNQALEKEGRISAINLTKRSMTDETIQRLKKGFYRFIYLGLEIFLNSEAFEAIYNSISFQCQLILKVVDEAHMIYLWGLVASGPGKLLLTFKNSQDIGVFRPAYGNLGNHLMATKNRSLRPQRKILGVVAPKSILNNDDLPVTIVYLKTQDATLNVMAMAQLARGTPEDLPNGASKFIQRYHAITGAKDKEKRADDFVDGHFPWMSSTSALGLGLNWKAVSCVVVVWVHSSPEGAVQLINAFQKTSKSDLSHLIATPVLNRSNPSEATLPYLWYPPKLIVSTIKPSICKRDDPICLEEEFVELAVSLVGHSEILYRNSPLKNCGLALDILFNQEHAWFIVKNY